MDKLEKITNPPACGSKSYWGDTCCLPVGHAGAHESNLDITWRTADREYHLIVGGESK